VPELPEAETIARGLRDLLPGRRIEGIKVLRPDLLTSPSHTFTAALTGGVFGPIGRRGKNLVLEVEAGPSGARSGSSATRLVVNLGMSGRLLYRGSDATDPPPTHPGVRFLLDDESLLIYHDPRRFGRLEAMTEDRFGAWSSKLGPEPLSPGFSPRVLSAALAGSSSPVRSWLLDQRRIAGVGNIYANEALFLAGIHPQTPARAIDSAGAAGLHGALRAVLREAIRARGTTLRDYRTAQGWEGGYAGKLRVYGRDGSPCPKCGTMIERIVFGGRSAFVCGVCQGVR